jgi:tetratricopeptide (TPR) repeat protein
MKYLVLVLTCAALVSAAELAAPRAALAQSSSEADAHAREAFRRGESYFRAGRYLEALAQFSAGYELSRRPLFLFNMGECARKLGERDRARSYYERYLAEDPSGPLIAKAKERLAALGPPPAPAAPEPAPAAPRDGVDPDTAPGPARPAPRPGSSSAAPAAVSSAPPRLAVREAPAPVAALDRSIEAGPARRPLWKRWPVWAGVAVGVAAAATAIAIYGSRDDGGCGAGCVDLR